MIISLIGGLASVRLKSLRHHGEVESAEIKVRTLIVNNSQSNMLYGIVKLTATTIMTSLMPIIHLHSIASSSSFAFFKQLTLTHNPYQHTLLPENASTIRATNRLPSTSSH